MENTSEERSRKRVKLNNEELDAKGLPRTFTSSISPPPLRRERISEQEKVDVIKSPFQLTWIRDLPEALNKDALSLKDLLGDPLISECWEFNYLHDLEFLMAAFDPDVRHLIKVHVIHGFWKKEDQSRINLQTQAAKYPNLTLHTAYMPEMFGTHHSKMLILFRHDATAQVIIHTANMIAFDWTNMTQAMWRSPLLPRLDVPLLCDASMAAADSDAIGSGARFKTDLLNYLRAYDTKRTICKSLIEQLSMHDFSEIRAALVASVPGRQGIEVDPDMTAWGWPGLKNVLSSIPVPGKDPKIVIQISSIASLGSTDKWLDKTFFKTLSISKNEKSKPDFKIIFPTADEIRRSLYGYDSGRAIHIKIQNGNQVKQLQYLKPLLCHWAGDGKGHVESKDHQDAGRKRAAPHVKTFVRFADGSHSAIDWMLVTSSNLSKQAWGEAMTDGGDIRICSYEIGVLVWPGLYGEKVKMVPTFKSDTPPKSKTEESLVVGARMAYDLPPVPYGKDDEPWCATASYTEPDWKGEVYNV